MGVHMRHRMIGFVPVHVDGDAIESRDSGHDGNRLTADRPGASNVLTKDRWYLRPRVRSGSLNSPICIRLRPWWELTAAANLRSHAPTGLDPAGRLVDRPL